MARPVLGYPTMTAAILALNYEGKELAEIANLVDEEPRKVRALLQNAEDREAAAIAVGKLVLSADAINGISSDAQRRGITATRLATMLLEAIGRDGLVDAVLDDTHA